MNIETYKQAQIIRNDISAIQRRIDQLKHLPKLISVDEVIVTYHELDEMGAIDLIVEKLNEQIQELETRFEKL